MVAGSDGLWDNLSQDDIVTRIHSGLKQVRGLASLMKPAGMARRDGQHATQAAGLDRRIVCSLQACMMKWWVSVLPRALTECSCRAPSLR